MMPMYLHTELGIEKHCPLCKEYYPFDEEFFFKNGFKNGVQKWAARCKACYLESYRGGVSI